MAYPITNLKQIPIAKKRPGSDFYEELRYEDLNTEGQLAFIDKISKHATLINVQNQTKENIHKALIFINPPITKFGSCAEGYNRYNWHLLNQSIYLLTKKNRLKGNDIRKIVWSTIGRCTEYDEINKIINNLTNNNKQ